MYRTLAEAAANCTRNITAGLDPVLTNDSRHRIPPVLSREDRLNSLLEDLQDRDNGKRVAAICQVAELGAHGAAAIPTLINSLDDSDWVVRVAAITALGEMGDNAAEAVPALIEALDKEDVCVSAAIALGRIGPVAKEAIEPLRNLSRRKQGFDCWCAEEALRLITARS